MNKVFVKYSPQYIQDHFANPKCTLKDCYGRGIKGYINGTPIICGCAKPKMVEQMKKDIAEEEAKKKEEEKFDKTFASKWNKTIAKIMNKLMIRK